MLVSVDVMLITENCNKSHNKVKKKNTKKKKVYV